MNEMRDNADSLNDDEQRRLRQIEDELQRDDPALAAAFARRHRRNPFARLIRRVPMVGPILGTSAGVVTIVVGLVLPAPIVGIVGFAVLVISLSRLVNVGPAAIADRLRSLVGLGREGDQPDDGRPGPARQA